MNYFTTDEDEAGEANYLLACITGCEPEPDHRPDLSRNDSTWPEDEARMTYKAYLGNVEDDGQDAANETLTRAIAHMHGVFDSAADAIRYDAELQRLCPDLGIFGRFWVYCLHPI
jgi:hypothetical protein